MIYLIHCKNFVHAIIYIHTQHNNKGKKKKKNTVGKIIKLSKQEIMVVYVRKEQW
jgi:hypothetical protein